jgi:tetratricopeptide (TPR) repeat protein
MGTARAQEPPRGPDAAEIPAYIEEVRRQMADGRRKPEDRTQIVVEAAETLDRAARGAAAAPDRASRWGQAVALIDEFLAAEPGNASGVNLALQAAIYRWAEGVAWLGLWRQAPGDPASRKAATDALDDAMARLRPLWTRLRGEPQVGLGKIVRYRLARAAADRAELEKADSPAAADLRRQGLQMLDPTPDDPTLGPLAEILRARMLVAGGGLDEAEAALKRAEGRLAAMPDATRAGATEEMIDVRIDLLIARRSFEEALGMVDSAKELTPEARAVRAVRVRAAQWISLFPGRERAEIEKDAFRRAEALRAADAPEARLALVALANAILEPDGETDAHGYELLAEGHLARGDIDQAILLNKKGAEAARKGGQEGLAWTLDYRTGAILFRANRDEDADTVLTAVAEAARQGKAGIAADQGAKASLLQILCRARRGRPGPYEAALRAHLAAFPDDSTSFEARFALATLKASKGDWEEAIRLFEQVPIQSARWLASREGAARAARGEVERLRAQGELGEARRRMELARQAIETYHAETEDPEQNAPIDLARVELELIPEVGTPGNVVGLAGERSRNDVRADRRERARLLWIACLALTGEFVDAEREARAIFGTASARDLVDLAGRLDRAGSVAPSDLTRRRLGYIARLTAAAAVEKGGEVDEATRAEATLRLGRGQLATGDLDGARRTLAGLASRAASLPAALIEPYAAALAELALFAEAADAYRAVARLHRPGSRPWLEARYGLALALYRGGKAEESRRLIEGTMALHPELGGGELKEKFLALRRRMEPREKG